MLSCKRSKFSLPRNSTYLNCAYMAPLLSSVEKAGIRGLRLKRNPSDVAPSDFFEQSSHVRRSFAAMIHCAQENRVAIIPSVSYGMATVAKNILIEKHQRIVVAAEQFPSNYYSWKRLADENGASVVAVGPPSEPEGRASKWNERILEAIGPATRIVAISHVHWADGTKFDLREIRKRTREVGALLIVDGTQSVGALPFDVRDIDPDALVVAGYKWLLGPYGIGVAYFGKEFDNGIPLEENWINRINSEDFGGLVNYRDDYQEGSLRYEVGEHSNFILIPMLLKAMEQLNRWGPANIQEYCRNISAEAIKELSENGYWIEDEAFRGHHLFGIRIPQGRDLVRLKQSLLKKNISVSFRGDAIRVSPNVYNTPEEMHRLAKVLLS